MRIAVIGSGNVGATLGEAWVKAGHAVTFGMRDPKGGSAPAGAQSATVLDAIKSAEVVVLAVPWAAVPELLESYPDWSGKIVVDCTNPIGPGFVPAIKDGTSAAEEVARLAKGAKVVKAFNTTGFNNMNNPVYQGKPVSMLFATDSPEVQKTAEQLIRDVGFEPVFAGELKQARYLEQLAMLWITMSMKRGRDFAFTVVTR